MITRYKISHGRNQNFLVVADGDGRPNFTSCPISGCGKRIGAKENECSIEIEQLSTKRAVKTAGTHPPTNHIPVGKEKGKVSRWVPRI